MTDPKRAIKRILKEWGHNIFLQKLLDEKSMKYSEKMIRYTVRCMYPGSQSFSTLMKELPSGLAVNSEVVYYFQDMANPKTGDRIYDDLPNGTEIYNIDFTAPIRGRGGKVVYWIAGATRENTK